MADSVFTKIINRELPAHFIYEDEHCVAILDKYPTVKGQTVLIPRIQMDYAFDLDDDTYIHLFKTAKTIAKALDTALEAKRTCLAVEGFELPHVHIKIYPLQTTDKNLADFLVLGDEADDEELALTAVQIQAALQDD